MIDEHLNDGIVDVLVIKITPTREKQTVVYLHYFLASHGA